MAAAASRRRASGSRTSEVGPRRFRHLADPREAPTKAGQKRSEDAEADEHAGKAAADGCTPDAMRRRPSRRSLLKIIAASRGRGRLRRRAGARRGGRIRAAAVARRSCRTSTPRPARTAVIAWEDQADVAPDADLRGDRLLQAPGRSPPRQGRPGRVRPRPSPVPAQEARAGASRVSSTSRSRACSGSARTPRRSATRSSGWTEPYAYSKQYEQHGYPIFHYELTAFICRALLGLPLTTSRPAFIDYLDGAAGAERQLQQHARGRRQRRPRDEHLVGPPGAAGAGPRRARTKAETIAWLRSCQLPGGGFTYQPGAEFGGVDDVAYTWAAVRAPRSCSVQRRPTATRCVALPALAGNADGGFGDRPGWASNPLATYYALDALAALGAPGRSRSADAVAPAPRDARVAAGRT